MYNDTSGRVKWALKNEPKASFGTSGDCQMLQIINMDEEIERRNGSDSLRCGLSVWLKLTC